MLMKVRLVDCGCLCYMNQFVIRLVIATYAQFECVLFLSQLSLACHTRSH